MSENNNNFKPGTIKALKLINFMCHESFELTLGPRVNFIIGPNGSGKSALLTALVVVLGGRATTTSRAKKASEFVMYGKKYARVTCILHNYNKIMEKDKAFRPDEYGKEIVIEKTIYAEDTSKLILKNDKGKKISERKQELDDILDHFSILINNPICILNQEISKTFLHSKRAEDKYELYMKATSLEQIKHDYEDAQSTHKEWGECNERKKAGFRLLNAEHQRCQEKVSFLNNRGKLKHIQEKLLCELYHATVRDFEVKIEGLEGKIDQANGEVETMKVEVDKKSEEIKSSQSNIEQLTASTETCKEEYNESKKKVDSLKSKEMQLKLRILEFKPKLDSEERILSRLKKDRDVLQKSIAEEKKKFEEQNAFNEDTERRKLEIERLQREIPLEQAREKTIRQHTDQLGQSMNETRKEFHRANSRVSELTNELSSKEALLRRLRGGQDNELRKYGDPIVKLCDEIDKHHQQKRFRHKPLGPLGYHIKLRSAEAAAALELCLGRNAHAFICDNVQDMGTLNSIIRRIKVSEPNFREPLIIQRAYRSRHDISKYKSHHEVYKTLLDYIEIDQDPVFNALVDRTSLESVLFIPEYNEAENLMITQSLVPRYTRCAYTKDCFVMYPRTMSSGYRCIAPNQMQNFCLFSKGNADQIREAERGIELIRADLRDATHVAKGMQDSLSVQTKEYDNNTHELRKILDNLRKREEQLLNLKTTLTAARPEQLSAFEKELDECLANIERSKLKIEEIKKLNAEQNLSLKDLVCERESAQKILSKRDDSLKMINSRIENERQLIRNLKGIIDQLKLAIGSKEKDIEQFRKEVDLNVEGMAVAKQNPPEGIRSRPPNLRPTNVILDEKRKIDRQLSAEIEENMDPHELMESLQKRMEVIEGLDGLKNHNQDNYQNSIALLHARDDGFRSLKTATIGKVSTTFMSVMRAMGMSGNLAIHDEDKYVGGDLVAKAKTLEMTIDTTPTQRPISTGGNLLTMTENITEALATGTGSTSNGTRRRSAQSQPNIPLAGVSGSRQSKRARLDVSSGDAEATVIRQQEKENRQIGRMTDTRSLSGGERSFSTVAFVLALWHHCASPFKLMDEIDVFMDMVTRRLSYNALITFARISDSSGQFIFFSPLELPKIDDAENMVRVFEMPRIIRQGLCPEPMETSSS